MKVYVDFDRTLFDCDRFLDDLYRVVNKYNISRSLFDECQNQCSEQGFNPYLILDLVKKKIDFDPNLYREIDDLMHSTSNYLYADALTFLKYLKLMNYEVIILTKGNSDYQREKIFNSHLDLWYNKIMVTIVHKGELDIDYQNSIFIDDNPKEIKSIIKKKPKLIIRVQRNNSKYSDIDIDKNILTVNSLGEIINKKLL